MKKLSFILFLSLLSVTSCTQVKKWFGGKSTPDSVVRQFIELSAQARTSLDKEKLAGMCVGEMKEAFQKMSDENFRLTYLGNNLQLKDIEITETKSEGEQAKVTYKVKVLNNQGQDPTMEENIREAWLVQNGDQWNILSIKPIGKDQVAFTKGMMF